MKTIEEIKEEYAREKGYKDWIALLGEQNYDFSIISDAFNEIAPRYAEAEKQPLIDDIRELRKVVEALLHKEECLSDTLYILEKTKHYELPKD